MKTYRQFYFQKLIPHWEQPPQTYHDWKFFPKYTLIKKHRLYNMTYLSIIVKVSKSTLDQNLYFYKKNKYSFPPLNDSNSFATVEVDADVNRNLKVSINCEFESMTIRKLNTITHICELERTQMRTILVRLFRKINWLVTF